MVTDLQTARCVLLRMVNQRVFDIGGGFKNRTAEHVAIGRGMLTYACGLGVISETEMFLGIRALQTASSARQMQGIRNYCDEKYANEARAAFDEFVLNFKGTI